MLTTQLMGASQNVAAHTPRAAQADANAVQQPGMPAKIDAASDHITLVPVLPPEAGNAATDADADKPALEVPKRVEMTIAVLDNIPDAVPKSIYDVKVTDEGS